MELPPIRRHQNISVKFLGTAKTETRVGRDQVTLPADATVRDVIQAMRDRYGVRLERAILTSDGRVLPHARIYLGDTDADDLAGLDTPVWGIDEVVLLSLTPLSGG